MEKILYMTALFLFFSCGQRNESGKNFNQTNFEKESTNKTVTNSNSDNKPIDIALKFINSYVEDCNKMNKSMGYIMFVNSSSFTTENFKNELKKIVDNAEREDPEMGLGINPLIPGNDHPDEGFEFESFDRKTNLIVVKGKKWADFKVTIKMIFIDNKWLVDGCGIINIPEDKQ